MNFYSLLWFVTFHILQQKWLYSMTIICRNLSFMVSNIWYISTPGWSLKTVDCNLLLKGQKISKSAKTQWFLKSSFREVLVFWCFKIVRYVKFCVLELFHRRAFAAPFTASTLLYTLRRIQTPQTYIHFTQMLSDTSFRYLGTLQDNNRHQQTPNHTNRRCQTPKKALQGFVAVYVDIKWRLLRSDGV